MTYTPNVPQGGIGQTLKQSQPLINANFAVLQTAFDQDHIDFNAAGAGKHTAIHYPAAATTAQATTLSGELALYSKLDANSVPRLTMSEPSTVPGTSGAQRQISGIVLVNQGTVIGGIKHGGAIPLFGGLIMLFGQVTTASATVSFMTNCGMVFPNACFVVLPINPTVLGSISINTVNASGFNVVVASSVTISFMAIGN
jgi:hypothetical protein